MSEPADSSKAAPFKAALVQLRTGLLPAENLVQATQLIREAAAQVQAWRGAGQAGFQISINKSPVQFLSERSHRLQPDWIAHLRGLGVGFLPEPLARSSLASGQLVARRVERSTRTATLHYAWPAQAAPGKALSWWLHQLERPVTRRALLDGPASV